MTQKYTFVIKSTSRIDDLTNLLKELIEKCDIITSGAAGRDLRSLLDYSSYDLFKGTTKIGHYKFDFKSGVYEVSLDLSGLDIVNYENIARILGSQFPEINLPASTYST